MYPGAVQLFLGGDIGGARQDAAERHQIVGQRADVIPTGLAHVVE